MPSFTKIHRTPIAGNISYITDDVLINILSRLPVKSLFQFKCLCKAWQSLISNPSLQGILPTTMSGLFYSTRYDKSFPVERFQYMFVINKTQPNYKTYATNVGDLSFFPHHREFNIIDCCNGLLLGLTRQGINNTHVYYVINPAMKKWAALPEPHNEHTHMTHMLAFDPCVSPHFTLICSGLFPGVDIFSSKTGVWVESKVPQQLITKPRQWPVGPQAVFFNHMLHMLSDGDSIVGFDVDEECFRLIPLPVPLPTNPRERRPRCIGVSRGNLYYAIHDCFKLQIWMLKDYDEQNWVLKHEITIDSLAEKHPQAICSSALYMKCHEHFPKFDEGGHLPFWLCVKNRKDEQILDNRVIIIAEKISRHYYLSYFSVLAFHPDLEVVFLGMGDTMLSYHLDSMKVEEVWVSKLHQNSRLHMGNVYPFSPCLVDF